MQLILSMLACSLVLSCAEKQVELGAGYKYVQLDGADAAIADRDNHMVVDPNVKRYVVINSYIVGERVNADIDPKLSKNYGYFIFDMRNGQLLEGLDKAKFDHELRARKLAVDPF